MCDTVVVVKKDRVFFAKNSDRDANEAQLLDWQPARSHPPGAKLRCTWIEIPQVARTFAVLLSRPFWMWGAEMGANEHGVVIGNEAVFTRAPMQKRGLLGMDLVRLGLERANTAEAALSVIIGLLSEHGQGGGAGYENPSFCYHNSFLIADAERAFVLETADRKFAIEEVRGVRSISNTLTIPDFAQRYADRLRTKVAAGKRRQTLVGFGAARVGSALDLISVLSSHGDHGEGTKGPTYNAINGSLHAPCAHGGGMVANSVTTASWISELGPGGPRHWATGTAAPCISLFKPVEVGAPVDLGPPPAAQADNSLWWRHERLHRAVLMDYERALARFSKERRAVQARWMAEPPGSAAFAEAEDLLLRWTKQTEQGGLNECRPRWARRYWRQRSAKAGFSGEAGVF